MDKDLIKDNNTNDKEEEKNKRKVSKESTEHKVTDNSTENNFNHNRKIINEPKNNPENKITGVILIVSILLSFVCGMAGAYLITKTVSVSSVVKNITTSELIENSISSSVDKVYKSTVAITASSKGQTISTGTGFIYKIENGKAYILTNNHVIDNADSVKVEFNDNSEKIEAKIVGSDTYADIAVLTIEDNEYQAVSIGDNETLKLGDTIFTVGSPMGIEYKGTVTKGILSGKERMVEVQLSNSSSSDYYMKVIQIDAAVNPGNSGGPLCDVSGNVIGIISLKIVQDSVEGMGFAIPIEDALKYAETIESGGKIERPYLGISMLDLSEEYYLWQNRITIPEGVEEGVAVVSVENNTPASKAGFKKGDIIIKINNENTGSIAEFRYELYKHEVGEKIEITFYRDGKLKTTSITLGKSSD